MPTWSLIPLNDLFKYCYYTVLMACVTASIIKTSKTKARQDLFFLFYLLYVVICDPLTHFYYNFFEDYKSYLYNIYFFVSISFFYSYLSDDLITKTPKLISKISGITTFVILSFIIFYWDAKNSINIFSGVCMALFLITMSLIWFFNQIQNPDEFPLKSKSGYWISVGILIWSSFFVFRLIPMHYLDSYDKNFLMVLQYFFNIINIITYLLYFRGLLCKPFQKTSNLHI